MASERTQKRLTNILRSAVLRYGSTAEYVSIVA